MAGTESSNHAPDDKNYRGPAGLCIATIAYMSLGGSRFYRGDAAPDADARGVTEAQVLLRWAL